uniref:Calcium voltage-gated channel auxiliary subunit alpha2delta 4 n=1 Tax=Sinocyclocheilus grahami TaxID=75366 RepID=A0A672NWG4_SINGR
MSFQTRKTSVHLRNTNSDIFDGISELSDPPIDSKGTTMINVQKRSKQIGKIIHCLLNAYIYLFNLCNFRGELPIHSSIPSIFCSSLSLYSNALVLLQFDYYNSMMINTLDEDGNNVELGGEFPLEENEHFNKVPVNTQQSVIQVPTNVYNKGKTQKLNVDSNHIQLYTFKGIKWTPDENGVVAFDARNRYYAHISTLADVQENVMEYLHVLGKFECVQFDFFEDLNSVEFWRGFLKGKRRLENQRSHGIPLGVVGTDVSLKELISWLLDTRCIHGYAFLNTNNGYILSHPDLRPLYKDGKKLKPKPNYNSVDLSEVEWEDTEDALRTAMVKGKSGTLSLDVRATVERRAVFLKNEYFYTTINETPFSLGIVLIKGHGKNVFIGNVSVEEGLHDLTASAVTITDHRKLTQFQAFCSLCSSDDERLLQHTLFDAVVTAPMEAYWTALLIDGGVETAFLGTRYGLMRMIRYVGVEKRVAKKFLSPSDKENIFTLDHFPVWYRRAAENPAGRFLYYVPIEGRTQGQNMHHHSSIKLIRCDKCFSFFFLYVLCSQDVNCYVIDSNGFIIISKDRDDVGKFLGEIDGSVRSLLLKMGMFKRVLLYDYQPMCKVNPHSASGARPLQSVSIVLLATTLIKDTSSKKSKGDILQPSDTEYPSFVYEPSIKETNSMIKCGRCQKVFVINQIPDSNLLLVVIQADCDCYRQYAPITMEPKEVKYMKCDRMRSQKIRRRPESCHAYHPQLNLWSNKKNCVALPLGGAIILKKLLLGNRWSDRLEIWFAVSRTTSGTSVYEDICVSQKTWPPLAKIF